MPDRQVSVTGDEETGFLPAGKDSTRSMQCCAGNIGNIFAAQGKRDRCSGHPAVSALAGKPR